jgi:predicted glycoside hydrolase/deacetylase ChbG (UPF0249 family)
MGSSKVSLGLHLNLSEGKPLLSDLRILVGADGCFLGKAVAHRLLMQDGDTALREEVSREVSAQIEVLRNAGIGIQHIDGHQHVHVFPAACRTVIQQAESHGIPWMRIPEEAFPSDQRDEIPASFREEALLFNRMASTARHELKGTGIRTTDHFRGLFLRGRLSLTTLEIALQILPSGLTELMVHPGRVPATPLKSPFSTFSNRDREQELEALLNQGFRQTLGIENIDLTPFPEIVN